MQAKTGDYSLIEKAQHVFPSPRGDWSVRRTGSERASRSFSTQQEAIEYARTLAKKHSVDVYVHRQDGRIASRDSYGHDPAPSKG